MNIVKNKAVMFGMLMLLSAFALSGSPALAVSNSNSTNSTNDTCSGVEDMDNVQDQNKNKSNDEDVNDAEDLCEKAESAKLASQVDISEGKARKIAEDNYKGNGKITEVQLGNDEDDNGVSTIIYEIEFTETDGNQVDVKVDAMSGKYFGVDTKDDEVASADEEVNGKNRNVHALQMQLMSLLQQLIALLKA